jgi:hypothetical protein
MLRDRHRKPGLIYEPGPDTLSGFLFPIISRDKVYYIPVPMAVEQIRNSK